LQNKKVLLEEDKILKKKIKNIKGTKIIFENY
jgi:hypothetical protein